MGQDTHILTLSGRNRGSSSDLCSINVDNNQKDLHKFCIFTCRHVKMTTSKVKFKKALLTPKGKVIVAVDVVI